jgi:hypothetical protein
MIGAGLLKKVGGPHDTDRTLAMLVLMSIHDIMKLDVLCPTVGMGVAEFAGYKSGEPISDHDAALSYVLVHCPTALPSFAGLSKHQQDSIKFTHCRLEYNMGWLVQAEAPPGALFRSFRKVVNSSKFTAEDIAFYFVHWFADLAGAEPFPLQGSEKFVLKFPQKVLSNFIDSFAVVWTLDQKSETAVLEDYLLWRWNNHEPRLGPAPTGKGSIAEMRLVCMAQGDSAEVLRQFENLPEEDKQILSNELAMTGIQDQSFERESLSSESKYAQRGPAILVYYSPALMQKAGRTNPRGALLVLAEVIRQARELWPLSLDPNQVNRTVTVRIDALKDLQVEQLIHPQEGYLYVIHKTSGQDGFVKLVPVSGFKKLDWTTHQLLSFQEEGKRRRRRPFAGISLSSVRKSFTTSPQGRAQAVQASL